MSPFSQQLKSHRIRCGLRQKDLAELVGYEQSYVSALELGLKGPPTDEFVTKLIGVLQLSLDEQQTLSEAVAASQRKISIPTEASAEVYWLCHKLQQQLDRLHPVQVELIETALNLPLNFNLPNHSAPPRIKRRSQHMHGMEAKM
ncbi:MAG: helix-turn-helix transcriptional regulator [Gallionella sp.]|nr:helix-turn-helix transcriptional regulator [Gallionella sp.]